MDLDSVALFAGPQGRRLSTSQRMATSRRREFTFLYKAKTLAKAFWLAIMSGGVVWLKLADSLKIKSRSGYWCGRRRHIPHRNVADLQMRGGATAFLLLRHVSGGRRGKKSCGNR